MNSPVPPPVPIALIPENAPFTPEQRAWLNGFFAGLVAPQSGAAAAVPAVSADEDDGAPWHDPAMPIHERMQLAEGKPMRRRLMAAMAQQDCGQCGYDCATYAEAIAEGSEARLNLCVPGEKQTLRVVKALFEELTEGAPSGAPASETGAGPSSIETALPGYSREHPLEAVFLARRRLNKAESEKSTYHIEIDLSGSGLAYEVGDSLGLYPHNDPLLVDAVIEAIHASKDLSIGGKTLREILLYEKALGAAPDALFELISYLTGGERRQKAKQLAKGEDPDGDAATLDVLAALEKFSDLRPDPEAFLESLDPLQPRLYSISSSPKTQQGRVTLTVDYVRYLIGNRWRRGVASSWLSEDLSSGTRIKAYVQKAHNFALPADDATPIIMVGPGTGIAPFRAFLHERHARKATGGAWLFFGHQRRATDFFYEEEMADLSAAGILHRLSLAWSRDSETKTYVQHKMREEAAELWAWLERGAHFYVCGDAKRMAGDVEKALTDVVAQYGGRDEAAAKAFIQDMKKSGRYQADVY